MTIIIPFEEVVRRTKVYRNPEDKRIREKEAIYRGLIADQARIEGRPFDEVLAEDETENADPKLTTEFYETALLRAREKGVTVKEAHLELQIEIQMIWLNAFIEQKQPLTELTK